MSCCVLCEARKAVPMEPKSCKYAWVIVWRTCERCRQPEVEHLISADSEEEAAALTEEAAESRPWIQQLGRGDADAPWRKIPREDRGRASTMYGPIITGRGRLP